MKTVAKKDVAEIDWLRKSLYVECRKCLPVQFQDDGEAVRNVRDSFTAKFGKPHSELSTLELKQAINEVIESRFVNDAKNVITYNQRKALSFYCVYIGINQCPIRDYQFTVNDKRMTEKEIRAYLRELFIAKKPLPGAILNFLYSQYINPLCNRWLIEGKFKKYTKNDTMLYYQQLSKDAAKYLIERLTKMYNEIEVRYRQGHIYDHSRN